MCSQSTIHSVESLSFSSLAAEISFAQGAVHCILTTWFVSAKIADRRNRSFLRGKNQTCSRAEICLSQMFQSDSVSNNFVTKHTTIQPPIVWSRNIDHPPRSLCYELFNLLLYRGCAKHAFCLWRLHISQWFVTQGCRTYLLSWAAWILEHHSWWSTNNCLVLSYNYTFIFIRKIRRAKYKRPLEPKRLLQTRREVKAKAMRRFFRAENCSDWTKVVDSELEP